VAVDRTANRTAETLSDVVERAATGPVVVRLRARAGRIGRHRVERVREWARDGGYPLLDLPADTAAPTAFGPVRHLLRQLLPEAEREAGGPLTDFAPELTMLLPELRSRAAYADAPELVKIALGGTKRRLHRDSERLFRLVSAVTSVVCFGLSGLARAHGRPAVLLVDRAELCDRYTLACLLHISRSAAGPGPMILLVTGEARDARTRWIAPPVADPRLARWSDAEAEQDRVLSRLFEVTDAVELPTGGPEDRHEAVPDLDSLSESDRRRLTAAVILADPVLAAGVAGPLDAELAAASREPAVREAVLGQLTAEAYRAGCAELAEELRTRLALEAPGDGTATEGAEAALAFLEVAGGQPQSGVRRAQRILQRSYGFTLNYELMLLCCRVALAGLPTGAGRLPVLLFAGLTHAYLDHHELATEIFEAAYTGEATPEVRAQVCYYLGLIASKRRNLLEEGRAWFDRGFAAIENRSGGPALLESGWLRNGMAMVAWREGRYDDAERLVRAAIADTEGFADAQLVNLRVNLVNNLSVLLETQGEYGAALEVWRSLAGWSEFILGGSFTKSYRYRESWLLSRLGDLTQAYACAVDSLDVARRFHDVFHMNIISRACAYLACRMEDYGAGCRWQHTNVELMRQLGHRAGEAHAYGQLAHVRCQAGDLTGAAEALDEAARLADGPAAERFRAARLGVAQGRRLAPLGPDDELFGIAMDRPKAKLTTPFSMAHLVVDDSYAATTHERALTKVSARRS
jgi:tetratricopeptide (TPR) repeat protein